MKNITGQDASTLPDTWTHETDFIDSHHEDVAAFTAKTLEGHEQKSLTDKVILLFNAVRDDIRYNPYQINFDPLTYKASHVAVQPSVFCVPKAILLTACLRSIGVPAAVGFADVKNHLNSPKLAELMETDLFAYHGYVALKLNGEVFKVTPTFNRELCEKFGVQAIEFDGTKDALFHEYDAEKRKHMEYVNDHGIFEDPPIEKVLEIMGEVYPKLKTANQEQMRVQDDPNFAA